MVVTASRIASQSSGLQVFLVALMALVGALFTSLSQAEAPSAHSVAEQVKNELISVIKNKDTLEKEGGPEKYFDAVEGVLVPIVDFDYIARGVMGDYGKQASEEQRERFAKTFQRGLVTTYAKGLAGYGDHDIQVVPPEGDVEGKRSVSVVLKVQGGDTTNTLSFSMKLNRSNEWKLTNMVLNGINLGKTFRNQFAQAMNKSGDLDQVIDNWQV